jgi:DNA-damage-inducible protein J
MIRARVEPELKDRAEAMLEEIGLSVTSAITLFYRQIVQRRGLPFELRLPNALTRRAVHDARTGRGVVEAGSMDELFAGLDAADRKTARRPKRRKAHTTR